MMATSSNDTSNEIITLEDDKAVDAALAKELNNLSVQERETIFEEIHGVGQDTPETPDFVDSCLDAMDRELRNIADKPAYDTAAEMSMEYVTAKKFRLMFLRSENFDYKKAAIRMVKFFAGKLRLFGKDTLVRSLYLSDLDEGDLLALESGCYQYLPSRDRSGRIVFVDMRSMVPKTWKRGLNLVKASTYLLMSALEDEETQRRGVIGLLYHMGGNVELDAEFMKEGPAAMTYLPFRVTCTHMCSGHSWVNRYARAMLGLCGPDFRARVRLHAGSHTEIHYSLMTFGLPMDLFPISMEGDVRRTNIVKWLTKRRRKEKLVLKNPTKGFDRVDMPGRNDILLGKGKPFQRHVGNIWLRTIVESHVGEYIALAKGEKCIVIQKVREVVKENGGRFLKRERDDWWTEVSEADALDKITKLFWSLKASWMKGNKKRDSALSMHIGPTKGDKRPRIGFCDECCPSPVMVPVDM